MSKGCGCWRALRGWVFPPVADLDFAIGLTGAEAQVAWATGALTEEAARVLTVTRGWTFTPRPERLSVDARA